MTDERWLARISSHAVSGREDKFTEAVRTRDKKCVITGDSIGAQWGSWAGLDAAHVFPLEKESLWIHFGYSRWITNMDDTVGVSKINSPQNGLLMSKTVHDLFDQYLLSINPDVSVPELVFRNSNKIKGWV